MMTQLFFLLLQPNQLERPLEVIAAAHPALDHCIFLGERVGRPLQAKSSLNLFCLDLLQRGSVSLLPALALPLFHLFGGTVLVTDLLIPEKKAVLLKTTLPSIKAVKLSLELTWLNTFPLLPSHSVDVNYTPGNMDQKLSPIIEVGIILINAKYLDVVSLALR